MREIKFRAWIKDAKEMEYEPKLHFRPTKFGVYLNGWFVDNNVFEITQYTELKDKNGKEIYEGDILEVFGERLLVEWFELSARYKLRISKDAGKKLDWQQHATSLAKYVKNGVVVGNIYENPELLTNLE